MRIAFDLDGVLADLHQAYAREALRLFPDIDTAIVASPQVGASPPAPDHGASDGDEDVSDAEAPSFDPGPTDAAATTRHPPPEALASATSSRRTALTRPQSEAVWRALTSVDNFWETLDEIEPGVIARLATLADARGWDTLFITSRPRSAGRTVQRQTQRWLESRGFPLPSVYTVSGSRGLVAAALQLDVIVDDRPENCHDVILDSRAAAILVWRSKRRKVPASTRQMGIAVVATMAECLDALMDMERRDDDGGLLDRLQRFLSLRGRNAAKSR
jgi:phosphoglycolate phosphatase-like HAD superfamily hydrolase